MRSGILVLFFLCLVPITLTAQTSTPLPSPTPMATVTPLPAAEATTALEPESTEVVIEPLLDLQIQPPIDIDLPQDWLFGYDTLVFREFDDTPATVPIAIYRGPVTDGTGEIVLLWAFDSIIDPFSGQGELWLDGVRLLRQLLFDAECNIGRFPPDDSYTLGSEPAVGVRFAVVDCPVGEDTRGWFVVRSVMGVNFAFYAYTEPITAMDGFAAIELQSILDSVIFRVEDLFIEPEALAATQQAFGATIEAALTQSALETPEATEAP